MTVRFCSVDPSISCTGISILEADGDKFRVIDKTSLVTNKVKYKDRWEKKMAALELWEYWLTPRIEDISFFVFESYSYGSPGHLADLGEMNGVFKHFLWKHGKPFDQIAPSSVKKFVTGNGRASKDDVKNSLADHLVNYSEVNFNNLDESDAVAVGIAYGIKMRDIINESKKD